MSLLIFSLTAEALHWNSPHSTFIWHFKLLNIYCLSEIFVFFFIGEYWMAVLIFPTCLVDGLNILQPSLSVFLITRSPWSIPAKSSTHFAPSDPRWAKALTSESAEGRWGGTSQKELLGCPITILGCCIKSHSQAWPWYEWVDIMCWIHMSWQQSHPSVRKGCSGTALLLSQLAHTSPVPSSPYVVFPLCSTWKRSVPEC